MFEGLLEDEVASVQSAVAATLLLLHSEFPEAIDHDFAELREYVDSGATGGSPTD